MTDTIKILAISGSLRTNSSNHTIINVLKAAAPNNVAITFSNSLDSLPYFNPTPGDSELPESVTSFFKQLDEADGVLISTPEYAFGVPGVLKNALDWTVSTTIFTEKPTALITASSQGQKGHAALLNTLTALGAKVTEDCKLLISFIRTKVNSQGEITDAATFQSLQTVLNALIDSIRQEKDKAPQ